MLNKKLIHKMHNKQDRDRPICISSCICSPLVSSHHTWISLLQVLQSAFWSDSTVFCQPACQLIAVCENCNLCICRLKGKLEVSKQTRKKHHFHVSYNLCAWTCVLCANFHKIQISLATNSSKLWPCLKFTKTESPSGNVCDPEAMQPAEAKS